VGSLYAHERGAARRREGALAEQPFFRLAIADWGACRFTLPRRSAVFPLHQRSHYFNPAYTLSLLADWEFDARLKPAKGFPLYYGWLGADQRPRMPKCTAVLPSPARCCRCIRTTRYRARLAAHRAWSRSLGRDVRVLAFGRAARSDIGRREIRERYSGAFRLGGTSRSVISVASVQAT